MDLSVIVVEYHSLEELEKCLDSTRATLRAIAHEILVVSNSNYSPRELRRFGEIASGERVIRTERNLGFAKAVNLGLQRTTGQYVLLLNSDCVFVGGSVEDALDFMRANPNIAVLGPRIVDGVGTVQESSRPFMTPWQFLLRVARRLVGDEQPNDSNEQHVPCSVDWVSGACMMVERAAIDRVGMMDGRYFMYVEDMDWCRNFRFHGYDVIYWPHLTVCHGARRASSSALSSWRPSRLMWVHFISFGKYMLKAARGAWR